MEIDPKILVGRERYKVLTALITPRPIALVTTLTADGMVNAAPYSFFNMMCDEPPIVVLGVMRDVPDTLKDTARNLKESGEGVIHLTDMSTAEAMNDCATNFPSDMSEVEHAGFTLSDSVRVKVPRLAECPAALEVTFREAVKISDQREILIAEVVHIHVKDTYYDAEKNYILPHYQALGRLSGSDYAETSQRFSMPRVPYAEWVKGKRGRISR